MQQKPAPPEDWECCESGCDSCVWDIYYQELREWQASQSLKQESIEPPDVESSQTDQINKR